MLETVREDTKLFSRVPSFSSVVPQKQVQVRLKASPLLKPMQYTYPGHFSDEFPETHATCRAKRQLPWERHIGAICPTTLGKNSTQTSSHLRGADFICLKPQSISLERISCSPGSFKNISVFQQIMFLTHCKALENVVVVVVVVFLERRAAQFIYLLSHRFLKTLFLPCNAKVYP